MSESSEHHGPSDEDLAARRDEERGNEPRFTPPTRIAEEPAALAVAEEQAAVENASAAADGPAGDPAAESGPGRPATEPD
jgi:hypothetical protein